jgi:outer membrane lipoprotein-sorting protein
MYLVLVLTVSLLFAAKPTKNQGAENEAEKLFRIMEEKLAKAKTLECAFEVRIDTQSYKGSLFLAPGNRARLEINEAARGRPMRLLIVSDGAHQSFQDNGIPQPQRRDTPKDLNAEILTWLARPGMFLPHTPLPDVSANGAKDRFRVSACKLGKKEKVEEREARRVEYQLSVKGLDNPLSVIVWLDVKTRIPVKRLVTERVGGHQTAIIETYGKITLDEDVDAKKFDLPK